MPNPALNIYVQQIQREYASGIAAEHAYRPALEALLESVDNTINAVNDPQRLVEGSAPDFVLLRQRDQTPVAFVEAKDIGVDLNRVEKDEQMGRYLRDFHNLILTDYLEFRWYLGGLHQRTIRLGEADKKKQTIHVSDSGLSELDGLLRDYINAAAPDVRSAKQLAERMASMTLRVRELIEKALPDSPNLGAQKTAFEQTLIPNLDTRQFADMYAQTLAYGLFAARVNYRGAVGSFTRRGVAEDIPRTNPFLRKLFTAVLDDLEQRIAWMVDTLIELLAHTDTDDILKDFGRGTRQNDPVLHFYETFLAEYDPALREKRGVYYTPEPVVSYIVRSVDYLLRERFNRPDGLADENTLILDPATGTGTFLYAVVQQIYDLYKGQQGMWDSYVSAHLLPRLFGFELLMAPYTVAHMKMGILLRETGYTFHSGQRLGIYLTNTLEEVIRENQAPFAQFITEEANEASAVKRQKPIMVVLGNPPYSGHSANTGAWISGLVRDYYQVDGKPLGERNPKWLQDDYVKFIRFGQWRINQTGSGVLAYISNNGYLDNPTFRGMRQHLMQTFSDIYILNLHGNSNKREKAPDGGTDENVFDIRQGVAIALFVKDAGGKTEKARVHYADLYGVRENKYHTLLETELDNTNWQDLSPQTPYYLFIPQDLDLKGEYEQGWIVTDIFPVNVLGFQSHRDHFAVDIEREVIHQRIKDMRETQLSDVDFRQKYDVSDNRDWKLAKARANLRQNDKWEIDLIRCAYRPFDWRYTYFSEIAMDYPRRELLTHVAGKQNLCLNTMRQTKMDYWQHALVSDTPAPAVYVEIKDGSSIFPLYLYPDPNDHRLLDTDGDWPPGKNGRTPNLSKTFVDQFATKLGLTFLSDSIPSPVHGGGREGVSASPSLYTERGPGGEVHEGEGLGEGSFFTPEDIFHYAYAVFHSPTYRARYAEFLKIDFPRLPLTGDVELFRALCAKGAELVRYHLLRDIGRRDLLTTFPVTGDNTVAPRYPRYEPLALTPTPALPRVQGRESGGRVYINPTQYFEGITPDVWAFQIGGYQVMEKWLKDRRGRTLSSDDLLHYQKIVVALTHTIRLMDDIDDLIPAWPLV